MAKGDKLTVKQEKFCYEYCQDYNATQAAVRAGYSKKTAYQIGHDNLKKVEIKKKILSVRKELIEEAKITPAMILAEYAKLAFTSIDDYLSFDSEEFINKKGQTMIKNNVRFKDSDDIEQNKLAAIQAVKQGKDGTSIKLYDKKAALDKLAEYYEMFKHQERELDVDINVTFDE